MTQSWSLTARPTGGGAAVPAGSGAAASLPAATPVQVIGPGAPVSASMGGRGAGLGGYSVQLGRGLGGRGQLPNWPAALEAPGVALRHSRDDVVARSRDLQRSDPQVRGGVARKADMVVGGGFLYSAQVNRLALGLTAEQARVLNRALELVYHMWAADPLHRSDRLRIQSVGEVVRAAYLRRVVDGDGLGLMRVVPDGSLGPDWRFMTAVQHIDTDRLSTPFGQLDTLTLRDGVETDDAGAPIAYHIRGAHPSETSLLSQGAAWQWTRVPRFDPRGRPVVLHLFDPDRPGALRGYGDLVAGLLQSSLVSAFREHEVANAAANALFLGIIQSNGDPLKLAEDFGIESPDSITKAVDAFNAIRDDYYGRDGLSAGGVRFARLALGDQVQMATQPRVTDFVGFTSVFERAMASSLGLSQEQFSADYSRTNYSSARASLAEIWRSAPRERGLVISQVQTPMLLCVIDDAYDSGLLQEMVDLVAADRGLATVSLAALPEPLAAPQAWTQASWTGPGRGQIDPTKEAEAASMRIAMGVSSHSREAQELGVDLEDILAERAADQALAAEYGVSLERLGPAAAPSNDQLDARERATTAPAPAASGGAA